MTDDSKQIADDIARILPKPGRMLEIDIRKCVAEVHRLRVDAALLLLFERGLSVPRVVAGKVKWFAIEHDPLRTP